MYSLFSCNSKGFISETSYLFLKLPKFMKICIQIIDLTKAGSYLMIIPISYVVVFSSYAFVRTLIDFCFCWFNHDSIHFQYFLTEHC